MKTTLHGLEHVRYLLDKTVREGRKVLVYFDPDVDGLFAGYFWILLLSDMEIPYEWYINSDREHGMALPHHTLKGMTLVNGDFTITRKEMESLISNGVDVISLDHHDIDEKEVIFIDNGVNAGVVINNQYHFEDPKNLFQSGAGVVWEVLGDLRPDLFHTLENVALVGITLLSDVRDVENSRARAYLEVLYSAPFKGYIRYLIQSTLPEVDYEYGRPRMDRNYVNYRFSPRINSLLRFNRESSAVRFILGQGLPEENTQAMQKELVEKMLEEATIVELPRLRIAKIVDGTPFLLYRNFVGLLASKLTDSGKSVIAYCEDGSGGVERASFRGAMESAPYRAEIIKYLDGRGHQGAFGIKNLVASPELWDNCNRAVEAAEDGRKVLRRIVNVSHLGSFASNRGKSIGVENDFLMTENQVYVKYSGAKGVKGRGSHKYQVWLVDGMEVLSFDISLTPATSLIQVSTSRGRLNFHLSSVPPLVEMVEVGSDKDTFFHRGKTPAPSLV